ncbi:alpha/beta hydrolase [Citricoccus sp. GCM10030269]|uniref:alpha/beta hydrolase n=1 Tax=Citricoccus sp. GCM10030269 TaxID=3273388 RepID=UPI003608D56B
MEVTGLTPDRGVPFRDIWTSAEQRATRARLRADMRRRQGLGARQKSALDGLVHALRRESMDRSFPERILLSYDLGSRFRSPAAIVAVGEIDTATHVSWQVSGMGISVHTAMWGSVKEAAQLWAAQKSAGAEHPCVISWLGYQPPGPWGVLSSRSALRGGARLALHLNSWFDHYERLRAEDRSGRTPPRPHTAVEAHSYGTVVAARALQILHRSSPSRSIDALVVSGAVGLPRDLAGDPAALGMSEERIYTALADTDYLSRLALWFSGRRQWTRATELKTTADEERNLAAAVGHNTSRYRPDARLFRRGRGYRDPGTASLYRIARATIGLPP